MNPCTREILWQTMSIHAAMRPRMDRDERAELTAPVCRGAAPKGSAAGATITGAPVGVGSEGAPVGAGSDEASAGSWPG